MKRFKTLADLKNEFIPAKNKNKYIDKITNNIYLGERPGGLEFDYFKDEGITNVISLIGEFSPESTEYNEETGIKRKILDCEDFGTFNIIKYFVECIEYIEKAQKTYVHCLMGVSRSASIVIAYLMWKTHSNYNDVFEYVKEKREWISPNDGFVKQLKLFGDILVKNNYDLSKCDVKNVKLEGN